MCIVDTNWKRRLKVPSPAGCTDDVHKKLLGTAIAEAQGDWMTESFVPFKTKLVFSKPTTRTGVLVFEKDNPSGLPEHTDSLSIPISFDVSEGVSATGIRPY